MAKMQKIANGHYRYVAAGDLGFDVYRYEGHKWNRGTGNSVLVSFWSWRSGQACNEGYATKQQAVEAALAYTQNR